MDEQLDKNVKPADKKTTIINFVIIAIIFVILLIYMVKVDGIDNIIALLSSATYSWVFAGLVCMILFWLCEGLCLHIGIKKLYPNQKFFNSFRISMIGQLFNNITPFCTGGQPMQAYYMYKDGRKVSDSFSIFTMKFIVNQTALVLFSLIVSIFQFDYLKSLVSNFLFLAIIGFSVNVIAIVFVLIMGVNKKLALNILKVIFIFLGKIRILKNIDDKIEKLTISVNNFNKQFNFIKSQKKAVIQMFVVSVFQSLFYYSITYMIYRAFGNSGISIFSIIPAQAFLLMLMTFVPTPGSGGGAEGGFLLIFNSIFKNGTINMSILFWRLYTFYLPIIVGSLFLISKRNKQK